MVPFAGLFDGIRSTDVQEDENVVGLLEEAAFARSCIVRPDQPDRPPGWEWTA